MTDAVLLQTLKYDEHFLLDILVYIQYQAELLDNNMLGV
jgi:hypothetical protein